MAVCLVFVPHTCILRLEQCALILNDNGNDKLLTLPSMKVDVRTVFEVTL